jgi:hypothetical protein
MLLFNDNAFSIASVLSSSLAFPWAEAFGARLSLRKELVTPSGRPLAMMDLEGSERLPLSDLLLAGLEHPVVQDAKWRSGIDVLSFVNLLHCHKAWVTHCFGRPLKEGMLGRDDDPTFAELLYSIMSGILRPTTQIFAERVGERRAAKHGNCLVFQVDSAMV